MSDIVEKLIKIARPPRQLDVEQARYRKEHKEELRAEAKKKLEEHRKKRLGL